MGEYRSKDRRKKKTLLLRLLYSFISLSLQKSCILHTKARSCNGSLMYSYFNADM